MSCTIYRTTNKQSSHVTRRLDVIYNLNYLPTHQAQFNITNNYKTVPLVRPTPIQYKALSSNLTIVAVKRHKTLC